MNTEKSSNELICYALSWSNKLTGHVPFREYNFLDCCLHKDGIGVMVKKSILSLSSISSIDSIPYMVYTIKVDFSRLVAGSLWNGGGGMAEIIAAAQPAGSFIDDEQYKLLVEQWHRNRENADKLAVERAREELAKAQECLNKRLAILSQYEDTSITIEI